MRDATAGDLVANFGLGTLEAQNVVIGSPARHIGHSVTA